MPVVNKLGHGINQVAVLGDVAEWSLTATANNALASVTKPGESGKSHFITAIIGSFSVNIIRLLTLKDGTDVIVNHYVHGAGGVAFDRPVQIAKGNAATLELAASGTAGDQGAVVMTGFTL